MVENHIASDGGSKIIRSSSSSVSQISGLSDELLVEILCRLGSPKYATQCKCVSKRWFSLIDTNPSFDSYFLRRWLQIHRKPDKELPLALVTQYLTGDYYHQKISNSFECHHLSLVFKSPKFILWNDKPLCILATCKDLVLCCPLPCHISYYIYNPFTKQWVALPPPTFRSDDLIIRVGFLVTYDDDNGHGFIFKVVRATFKILDVVSSHKMNVEIFSSDNSTGEWKKIVVLEECRHVDSPYLNGCPSFIYNGMMVWMGSGERHIVGLRINPHASIVEDYIRIPVPSGYKAYSQGSLTGVCKGCLRIAMLDRTEDANRNDITYGLKLFIWELDNYGQSWELVHELDFSEIEDSRDSSLARRCYQNEKMRFDSSIMAFHPHNGDLLYLFFVSPLKRTKSQVHSHILLCNVRKKTLKLVGGLPLRFSCRALPLLLPSWPTPVPRLSNSTGN